MRDRVLLTVQMGFLESFFGRSQTTSGGDGRGGRTTTHKAEETLVLPEKDLPEGIYSPSPGGAQSNQHAPVSPLKKGNPFWRQNLFLFYFASFINASSLASCSSLRMAGTLSRAADK